MGELTPGRCSGPTASNGLPERDPPLRAARRPARSGGDHRGVEYAGMLRDISTFPTRWLERAGFPPGREEDRRQWISARIGEDRDLYGPTPRQFLADARRARFENLGRLVELERREPVRKENEARLRVLHARRYGPGGPA